MRRSLSWAENYDTLGTTHKTETNVFSERSDGYVSSIDVLLTSQVSEKDYSGLCRGPTLLLTQAY